MYRVSVRTLVLMVVLLIAVAAHQYLVMLRPAPVDAVWLAGSGAAIEQTQSGCDG